MSARPLHLAANAVRGALIGSAEVVPGVSGGTVALVTGVYERLIDSAGHVVNAVRVLPTDRAAARVELRRVDWGTVLPLGVAMLLAVVTLARVIEPLLEEQPERSRALFLGLVLASVVVPAAMVGRWGRRELLLGAGAAVAAVLLTSIPPAADASPPLAVVFVCAAFAICALVLPGVSGSFLLLSLGVYEPTLAAVNERDYPYLLVFMAGAITGLALFVKVLQHLLTHRRRATLAIMTGLMIGSLRALWPWQDDDRGLLAPDGDVGAVLALTLLGIGIVAALLLAQARTEKVGLIEAARELGEHPMEEDEPTQTSPRSASE